MQAWQQLYTPLGSLGLSAVAALVTPGVAVLAGTLAGLVAGVVSSRRSQR